MTKTKLQIQGYIETNIYKHYKQWQQSQGINNDSLALNYILADFFGLEYPINQVELNQRLESFEDKLGNLNQKVDDLTSALNQVLKISPVASVEKPFVAKSKNKASQKDTSASKTIKKQKSTKKAPDNIQNDSYETMTKKDLFKLLTQRKIPHRISPKDRLKRKDEMVAELLAWDKNNN